ncbi:hypothetical protein SAMN05428946_2565 [Edaphobacillus lindanitolerans]|uniref:Uncharacterized protein n=1 Tax=Edaphobacillus lindanitolerans TaxID=550447 RepID=A0A1U7PPN6_9BACI|nr:hypothetical protein SAMN05428946_2565 [Edaphobacillus lindanitolerans]
MTFRPPLYTINDGTLIFKTDYIGKAGINANGNIQ